MLKRSILSLTLVMTLASTNAWSQKKWSLQECLDYATENNLQIKQQQLSVDAAEKNHWQAKYNFYPNLNGSASGGLNVGRSIDPFTNAFTTQTIGSNNFSVSSSYTLYNGNQNKNSVKQLGLNAESSRLSVEVTKNNISLSIVNTYMQVIFNREQIVNAQASLKNIEEQIVRTKELIAAGVLAKNAALDLESQKATTELQIVNLENAEMFARVQLKQFLQLTDEGLPDIVVPELGEPNFNTALPTVQQVYEAAETSQPQIRKANIDIESSEVGVDIARASLYPNVSLNASISSGVSSLAQRRVDGSETFSAAPIGYTSQLDTVYQTFLSYDFESTPYFTQINQNTTAYVGFRVSIPIFNRHQVTNSIQQAKIRLENSKVAADLQRNQLRQTIEQAYLDVVAAKKTYIANQTRVTSLEETFRINKERYELGTANAVDFNIANNNLAGAKSDVIRAKYDYIFKLKILDFYQGKEITL